MGKSLILTALLTCLLISCNQKMMEQPDLVTIQTVYASLEDEPETRNAVINNDVTDIQWTTSDAINLFFGESVSSKFVTQESGKIAKFQGSLDVAVGGGEGLTDETSLWGVYPYKSTTTCDGTYVYYTLQSEQAAAENTFAKELFPQIARSRNFYLTFYNPCASVRFTVASDDIKAVSLKGNNGEYIAGKAKISMESVPTVESIEFGETELLMYAPDGGCFTPGVNYYFVLFPTEFTGGLSVTYYKENTHATYSYTKAYTLVRNKVSRFSNRDDGLTFESGSIPDYDGKTYTDLSDSESANCYLVSVAGDYKFRAVQGNTFKKNDISKTGTSVGTVDKVEVLWESFGTTTAPNVGDLISSVSYRDGYVRFSTPATFQDGNALIAAKDASGTILWSWHIWCASEGWKEQVYYNDAGTMMDRNLGATSATPGEVGSLGLLYQWGRKEPFLGSSSVTDNLQAVSTGTWSTGSGLATPATLEQNPMTFYTRLFMPNGSWDSKKTAYDPCPAGWRVPDGGENGTWETAKCSTPSDADGANGLNCSNIYGPDEIIWYPTTGYMDYDSGSLSEVGNVGRYWSVTPEPDSSKDYYACDSAIGYWEVWYATPSTLNYRSTGESVRCLKE